MALQNKETIESDFLLAQSAPAKAALTAAMRTHASNIQPVPGPRSSGPWISALRKALNRINENEKIPGFTVVSETSNEFDKELVEAVRAYKDHRKILGPGQTKVDTIVGRGTMAQIDIDLKAIEGKKPEPQPDEKQALDIVVNITFGGETSEGEEQGSGALRGRIQAGSHQTGVRELIIIRFVGSHKSAKNPSVGIADRVVKARKDRSGKTCIFGASVGGKNVLQVAGMLTERGLPIAYLGISDGAFFHDDAVSAPGLLSSTKDLRIRAQTFRADESANFFTLVGVKIAPSISRAGLIWTSELKGEIHGPVNGFIQNVDLSTTVAKGPSISEAHDQVVFFADAKHELRIKDILS